MKPKLRLPVSPRLLNHFATFQSRFGLWRMKWRFALRRLAAEQRLAALLATNQQGNGATYKIKTVPRITRMGPWLRRFSRDELPHFYTFLIGEMSLVGPRPPVPREVALYALADHRRLLV